VSNVVFGLLAQTWVPWTLSGLIVTAAVATWLDFRFRRIEPVLAGLDQAIGLIEAGEGPSGFKRRFQAIYKGLAENPVVGEVWRAYASTIAPAPGADDALGYSRRPNENFNDGLLAVAGVNLRLYHAVPNLLVGSGLLFTFLGLVAALYFASRGIAAAQIAEAQHALRELLAAATFKFVTSIAGLGSSLFFSWREKALLYRAQRRLARLCAALEERMVPVTSESLAMNQLGELKAQHAELRKLSRNLILRVPEEIEARLADELANAVVPLRKAIAAASVRLEHLDEWVMEALVGALHGEGEPVSAASRSVTFEGPRARLAALIGSLAALPQGGPPPGPAAQAASQEDTERHFRLPLPQLRRLDERLGEVMLAVRHGIGRLAQHRGGRDAGRPADALRALTGSQAALEEARAAARDLARELEDLSAALGAAFAARMSGQELPPAVEAQLAGLDQRLAGWMRSLEGGIDTAARRLGDTAAQLETAERR
jgi:hypothetical protein